VLLDDFSVIESPGGANKQLLVNGNFESSSNAWRFLGTHRNAAVIVDPDNLFTDMKFAVQLTGEGSFDLYYLLAGASNFVNAATFQTDNKGNTNYLIDVTGGYFDAIQIVSSGASIFELKQISMNEAVPEPTTWALMLLGFGCIGWRLRRRNRRSIPQLA